MALETVLKKTRKMILTMTGIGLIGLPIYQIYYFHDWLQREDATMMKDNPVWIRNERSIIVYGFNTDNDPEVDKIVRLGGFNIGLRGGIPMPYKRVITEKDPGFESEMRKYR